MTRQRRCSVYTQWNITQPLKKNEILPFATMWIELEGIMLSEISQSEKDRYQISYVFTHMWILKNLTEDQGGGEGGEKVTEREGSKP